MTGSTDAYSRLFARLGTDQPFGAGESDGKRDAIPAEPPIDMGGGIPDFALLPREDFIAAFADALHGPDANVALTYSDFHGIARLRRRVAAFRDVPESNVLITNGAMNGIFFAVQSLIDPGDVIAVENPTFPYALTIFRNAGARIETIPLEPGGDGIDVEALESRLRQGARYKALYTVPDFQNPTGAVLAGERKLALARLAERYGFTIISDNPYRDLWFEREPDEWPREYRARESGGPVIEIGSFSKVFGPGWRVGWIIADRERIERLAVYRPAVDSQTSGPAQLAVASLLEREGWFEALLTRQRAAYGVKANALYETLVEQFGDDIEVRRPRGGYFLWARLAPRFDPADPSSLKALAARNVRVVPGDVCYPIETGSRTIRLAFSHLPQDLLVQGARRIGEALRGRP